MFQRPRFYLLDARVKVKIEAKLFHMPTSMKLFYSSTTFSLKYSILIYDHLKCANILFYKNIGVNIEKSIIKESQ